MEVTAVADTDQSADVITVEMAMIKSYLSRDSQAADTAGSIDTFQRHRSGVNAL